MIKTIKNKIYKTLRWSEKWTKTDMVYLASGNFWLISGRIISIAMGTLLTYAFANLLDPERFGTYKYIISLSGFLTAFSLTGMGTSVTKAISKGYDGILKYSNQVSFRWGLVGSFLSISTAVYFFVNHNNSVAYSLLILAITAPLLKVSSLYVAILSGKKEFKKLTNYSITRSTISIFLMITILLFSKNVIVIAGSYFIINCLLSLIIYKISQKTVKIATEKTTNDIEKEVLGEAKHFSVIGIFTQGMDEVDKLLLFHFAGPIQLAIYTFSLAPIKELKNILENISPLAFPKFANRDFILIKKNMPFRIFQITIVLLPIIAMYIALIPIVFKFLFPKYMQSVVYTQVLSLLLLVQPANFIETALTAHAKIKQRYTVTISSSIIRVVLFLVLIPLYKIWGIIASILISEMLRYLILIISLHRTK